MKPPAAHGPKVPEATFWLPPPTAASCPSALFSIPPTTALFSFAESWLQSIEFGLFPAPVLFEQPPRIEPDESVAALRHPPLTAAVEPLAVLKAPPPTDASDPEAVLALPPPIHAANALAVLSKPPL